MTIVSADSVASGGYDMVVVGTGFGSLFFLHRAMNSRRRPKRVLMLERGRQNSHAWQIENGRNSDIDHWSTYDLSESVPKWNCTLGLGGGTNCWEGITPRMYRDVFRSRSLYGRGIDWPVGYDDLERYYCDAEDIMLVAGPGVEESPWPRSRPYPMPPHRLSSVDEALRRARPNEHFAMPTAILSQPHGARPSCCGSSYCTLCPTDAKFTALNSFETLFNDPDIDIVLGAEVRAFDIVGGAATRVRYVADGREHEAAGDLFVLGANAIHSPAILLRSGLDHPAIGRGMEIKVSLLAQVFLDGLEHFDGGTMHPSMNTALASGPQRREHGAMTIIVSNAWPHGARADFRRWREAFNASVTIETETLPENRITLGRDGRPRVIHRGAPPSAQASVEWAWSRLPEVFSALPVERIERQDVVLYENHLQGTLRMGADAATSAVDPDQILYDTRNIAVVGTSVMPSTGSVNPSLTGAALSLRAADRIFGGAS